MLRAFALVRPSKRLSPGADAFLTFDGLPHAEEE